MALLTSPATKKYSMSASMGAGAGMGDTTGVKDPYAISEDQAGLDSSYYGLGQGPTAKKSTVLPAVVSAGGGGVSANSGASSTYNPAQSTAISNYIDPNLANTYQQTYDMVKQQADLAETAREGAYTRTKQYLSDLMNKAGQLTDFNRGSEETALSERLAGEKQAGLSNIANATGTLRPQDIEDMTRAQEGASRVGSADIDTRQRAAQLDQLNQYDTITKMLSDTENQYNPQFNYQDMLPFIQAASGAQGQSALNASGGANAATAASSTPSWDPNNDAAIKNWNSQLAGAKGNPALTALLQKKIADRTDQMSRPNIVPTNSAKNFGWAMSQMGTPKISGPMGAGGGVAGHV